MSIKEAATHLKIPQYNLRAIENGIFPLVDPDISRDYCRFPGLGEFVASWCQKNREPAD